MAQTTKSYLLDDRHWFDPTKTICRSCQHAISLARNLCSAFPDEIPPDYWNKIKKCPKFQQMDEATRQRRIEESKKSLGIKD